MQTLSVDIETYSSISLQKSGVYRYVEAPDFEILLFGYSVDSGPVQVIDLACGEKIPEDIMEALTDDAVIKWAFNANFERICLSQHLKNLGISLDPFHDNHEKVNPAHPDKVADRIAGAIVDLAYQKDENPKIAVEVLIGHGVCHIVAESSVHITNDEVASIVYRIGGDRVLSDYVEVPQDEHLADNQSAGIRCGDNGIFKGMPVTAEQKTLTEIAKQIYAIYDCDGKYILDETRLIICQSNAKTYHLHEAYPKAEINPLGDWTGGTDIDTGAVNRKLGSDMGDSVTGGGLHGKDLSKADVSVNIYAWLKAQETGTPVELTCAIGDDAVDGIPYERIVETARAFIDRVGGFEKFAEWGLIC